MSLELNDSSHIIIRTGRLENFVSEVKENKPNSTNLYPPTKGYLKVTCKSQNINPIYLTLSSPSVSFRSLQTPVKYVLVLSLTKVYLHLHNFNI